MIETPDLHAVCRLVIELTTLRQSECKNLCIENFAPELFGKLLTELAMDRQSIVAELAKTELAKVTLAPQLQANGEPWNHKPGAVNLVKL